LQTAGSRKDASLDIRVARYGGALFTLAAGRKRVASCQRWVRNASHTIHLRGARMNTRRSVSPRARILQILAPIVASTASVFACHTAAMTEHAAATQEERTLEAAACCVRTIFKGSCQPAPPGLAPFYCHVDDSRQTECTDATRSACRSTSPYCAEGAREGDECSWSSVFRASEACSDVDGCGEGAVSTGARK
jgi:hypothetical protein